MKYIRSNVSRLMVFSLIFILVFSSVQFGLGTTNTENIESKTAYDEYKSSLTLRETTMVSSIQTDNSNFVVLYDAEDNITALASNLFQFVLGERVSYNFVPVSNLVDLELAISSVSEQQVVMSVFHGLPDGFRIGKSYESWDYLQGIIYTSPSKHHVLASCFSSILDTQEGDPVSITGIKNYLDYEVAIPMLTIPAMQYLYEIDGLERPYPVKNIEYFFDENNDLIAERILNPQNILGQQKVLHHYTFEQLEKLQNAVKGVANYLNTSLGPMVYNIFKSLFSVVPDALVGPLLALAGIDSLEDYAFDLTSVPTELAANFSNFINEEDITIVNKVFEFSFGNITVFLEIKRHRFLDGETEYNFQADVLQFGFKFDSNPEVFQKTFIVGGIPITIQLNINGLLINELLIDYDLHDPDWNGEADPNNPINPDVYEGTLSDVTALLGYVNMPGPYKELTIEAWFGLPNLGIPIWLRTYGGFTIHVGVTTGIDMDKMLKKVGHSDSKIKKIISKISDNLAELGALGSASLYIIFSGKGDGIKMTLHGNLSIGLSFNLEINLLGGKIKFKFEGGFVVNAYASGTINWDDDAIWVEEYTFYHLRLDVNIKLEAKVKFKIGWIKIDKKVAFDLMDLLGLPDPYYLPNGDLNNPDPDIPFNVKTHKEYNTYTEAAADSLSFDFPISTVFGGVGDAIASALNFVVGDNLDGTTEVKDGTIHDQTPPMVAILTPNTDQDPILQWSDPASLSDILLIVDELTGETQDLNSELIIDGNTLGADGSLSLQAIQGKPNILRGDAAAIDIYAFDLHDIDNTDSFIPNIEVEAKFLEKRVNLGFGLSITEYGSYTYDPYQLSGTGIKYKQRLYVDISGCHREVHFKDSDGNEFFTAKKNSHPGMFTGLLPWVETEYISISYTTSYSQQQGICGAEQPFSVVDLHYGELQFTMKYTSQTVQSENSGIYSYDQSEDISEFSNGGLILTNTIHNDQGTGFAKLKTGFGINWTLEIPIHKFYSLGLIPAVGTVDITVRVFDNSGLEAIAMKTFVYEVPIDKISPDIDIMSDNLQSSVDQDPSPEIARTGQQSYKVKITEPVNYATYSFQHGYGGSGYPIFSGLADQIEDQVSFFKVDSRVIEVTGSGTDNGFNFALNQNLIDDKYFSAEFRMTGSFHIYLQIANDVGITYLTYNSYTQSPYASNGYAFIPTSSMDLNNGNWSTFIVDIESDLRKIYPNANVTSISSMKFRGTAQIDNIYVEDNLLMDAEDGTTTGWSVYDSTPSGATINNLLVEKPDEVTVPYTWSSYGTDVYSYGILTQRSYKLDLDTSLLPTGRYALSVSAYDNLDNGIQEDYWIIIDHDAPTGVSFDDIIPVSYSSTTQKYSFQTYTSGTDNYGIETYKFYNDGLLEFTTSSQDPILEDIYTYPFVGNWQVEAVDYAGNSLTSSTVFYDGDYDGDGLTDFDELDGTYPSSATDADSDNDGLNDYQEEITYGSDSTDTDTDDDLLNDYVEVYTHGTNPAAYDTDGDGLGDYDELYGWMVTIYNIPFVGDESFVVYSDPTDTDSDNDGLDDHYEHDNHLNPGSSDTDGDSMADYWEYINLFDPSDYSDKDGNPDGDSLKNYQEENAGTDPRDADTDNDTMPDGWELSYGLNPLYYSDKTADPDSDYIVNHREYAYGLNPNSANVFSVSSNMYKNNYGYIIVELDFNIPVAGTVTTKLYNVGCSTCTSGTNVKTWTNPYSTTGAKSSDKSYNPSVTGYYRIKVQFVTDWGQTLYYYTWQNGYVYHYESSGGGGGGPM